MDLVDPANHIWLLRANLKLEQGAELDLHGSSIGGDVDQLRLKSDADGIVWVRAGWGTIDIKDTAITSWDEAANGPDIDPNAPRAYIAARSYLDDDGVTAYESRMDIDASDIGYLGYHLEEAYGLSWKALGVGPDVHSRLHVYGDVTNSRIHDNYFGAYTYGALGMHFLNNEVDHNAVYGLDPHDDSNFIDIEGNLVHDNGDEGIISSKRCNYLIIRNNISRDNNGNGILLHINSNDALVEGNQVLNNGDDGISLFDSHRNTIRNNMIQGNRSGIRLRVGSSDNVISGNEIGSSLTYGVYLYQGSDPPTSGDGRPRRNTFIGNIIHDSGSDAIKLTDADDNTFSGNIFANNDSIVFQRGLGNRFTANTLPSTAVLFTLGDLTFASITYISDQASIAVQVDRYSTIVFDDTGGRVFDLGSPGKATTITPSGSALMLGQADIGTIPSLITTRDFRITITDQSVLVRPVTWQTSGDLIKEWTTQAAFATQGVTYTVGDLAADTTYMVEKNGATLMILTSDASGHVSFDDIAGTTDLVAYTMQPITS